jgi:hypothetical protein
MSNSKLCGSEDWKSLGSTIHSLQDSRQPSCNDKFGSYHLPVESEEQSADAAWRDFESWPLKWMQVRTAAVEHGMAFDAGPEHVWLVIETCAACSMLQATGLRPA